MTYADIDSDSYCTSSTILTIIDATPTIEILWDNIEQNADTIFKSNSEVIAIYVSKYAKFGLETDNICKLLEVSKHSTLITSIEEGIFQNDISEIYDKVY